MKHQPPKHQPAQPEEYAFAVEVNRQLAGQGAAVVAFMQHDPATDRYQYALTFQCGSRRHTITSETPFHYDSVDDLVKRVEQWIAGIRTTIRWTTSLEDAEAQATAD